MNILYRGIWQPPKYKFECDRCGSVWECDENEVQRVADRNDVYVFCLCPVCGKKVMKDESHRVRITKAVDK